jgi:hypothetical protein
MNTIRLGSAAELLATLPYQLGYHPRDSLVVVELRARRLGLFERIDLPPAAHAAEAAALLVEPMVRHGATSVILVGYETQVDAAGPLLDELRWAFARDGIAVVDTLLVRDGRYYSLDCDAGCCPVEGAPLPDPSRVSAVADFVAQGRGVLPSRESVVEFVAAAPPLSDQVDAAIAALDRGLASGTPMRHAGAAFGLEPPGPSAMREHADRARLARRRHALSLWAVVADRAEASTTEGLLSPAQVADLVVSLRDRSLRDIVIAWWCPGSLGLDAFPGELVDEVRSAFADDRGPRPFLLSRLAWVARAVGDEHAAPVLTVLANVALHEGDGTLARVALDRALEHSPGYTLARLLSRMLDLGIRPDDVPADTSAGSSGGTSADDDGPEEVVQLRSA